jgi:N6-adenosine-specific RNA methylase IME4
MTFDVITIDPPHLYYGDPNKMGAAGKEYDLMTPEDIGKIPIKKLMTKNSILFCWATCPKLNVAIQYFKDWGVEYRGVAYTWVKTNKEGRIINGQGVRPTYTKPTTELLLYGSLGSKGRPLPIYREGQKQVVLASRGKHSEKPEEFRTLIEENLQTKEHNLKCLEIFARQHAPGWTCIGNELSGKDVLVEVQELIDGA